MANEFETWYSKFLEQPISRDEKTYLRLLKPKSKEGILYVKVQKELLRKAFNEGIKYRKSEIIGRDGFCYVWDNLSLKEKNDWLYKNMSEDMHDDFHEYQAKGRIRKQR